VAGDVEGLGGVVLADAAWHEKGFDPGDDHGDAGPGEDEVEDAEAVAAEVEVMDTEAAEEDGEENADDLVLAGAFVFSVEPGSLVVVHVGGVDGIDWIHSVVPLGECRKIYAEWRMIVPTSHRTQLIAFQDLLGSFRRNLQGFLDGVECGNRSLQGNGRSVRMNLTR
jgi:hypothetical protein